MPVTAIQLRPGEYEALRRIAAAYPGSDHSIAWPIKYDTARSRATSLEDQTGARYSVFRHRSSFGFAPATWLTKSFLRSFSRRNPGLAVIPNPAGPGLKVAALLCGSNWRKTAVTDRALRYRANAPECQPEGPKRCLYCGATRDVMVHHLDGHEENLDRENLGWACRSCNGTLGALFKRLGIGRRVQQYNPAGGAQTLSQWVAAVTSICRRRPDGSRPASCSLAGSSIPVREAVALVRQTPASRRAEFARQIAQLKRRRGTGRRRRDDVPF